MIRAKDLMDRIEPDTVAGCWLWSGNLSRAGYGRVRVSGKEKQVHRVMWEAVNGPISRGLFVCHKCDVRACCNPDHLFLGDHQDNMTDSVVKRKKRRAPITFRPWKGKRYTPHNVLLTEEIVREIRASDEPLVAWSRRLNISYQTLYMAKSGRTWAHVV